jgi:catechol 2,3-dioxygenase-like lactoylglutathione lyase family enzyme
LARGLDHIVHAVRDLDAAGALYQSLGFTVGARNKHPWGTHNRIVQFDGFFIELLTLTEPDKLGDDGFSKLFGRYTGDFLTRSEGLALLILQSLDARADEGAFRAAGIAASQGMTFEREGKRPDGTPVKVGFSLAFAEDKLTSDIHFATCKQHYPENFWNSAFQNHANGVSGIAGVVLVAAEPASHLSFMQNFAGATPEQTGDGFMIATPRGAIEVVAPAAFLRRFGVPVPETGSGARLAAMRFMGGPEKVEVAMGAVLIFER